MTLKAKQLNSTHHICSYFHRNSKSMDLPSGTYKNGGVELQQVTVVTTDAEKLPEEGAQNGGPPPYNG